MYRIITYWSFGRAQDPKTVTVVSREHLQLHGFVINVYGNHEIGLRGTERALQIVEITIRA